MIDASRPHPFSEGWSGLRVTKRVQPGPGLKPGKSGRGGKRPSGPAEGGLRVQGMASVPARVGPGRMECRPGRADGCQGVKGEWRTMTLRAGVQGSAERRPAPAGGPWRVREGSASPERRVSGAGVRGRQPPANGSPRKRPKDDCAGYLVSKMSAFVKKRTKDEMR